MKDRKKLTAALDEWPISIHPRLGIGPTHFKTSGVLTELNFLMRGTLSDICRYQPRQQRRGRKNDLRETQISQ